MERQLVYPYIMNALIIIYTLAISGRYADAMATTTKPLDLNDPSIIHTTQEEYDGLMKNFGFGSYRGTDKYEWPIEKPSKEIMPFQNDRIGFLCYKHFKDPEKAKVILNSILGVFGAPQPEHTIAEVKALYQTMVALRKFLMKAPQLPKNYLKGYKLLGKNKRSPLSQSWEDINMMEMRRAPNKNILETVFGTSSFTSEEEEFSSLYNRYEELFTETDKFFKDKPLHKYLEDTYKFKMKQYGPTIDTECEMPIAYSFPKDKISKEFLMNEGNDNHFKKSEVEEYIDHIKPPLEPPPKQED